MPDHDRDLRIRCLELAVNAWKPGMNRSLIQLANEVMSFAEFDQSDPIPIQPKWVDDLQTSMNQILSRLNQLEQKADSIMSQFDDLQAKADATLVKVTALADPLTSIKAALDAKDASIADLQKKIDDMVASGSVTPTQLAALSKTIDDIVAATDNQALAEGALAGTPAAPPAP